MLLGDVAVSLSDARGRNVPIETVDNGNNTFEVMFVPETVGPLTASVYFGDVEVDGSPFVVDVQPHPSADQPDSGSYQRWVFEDCPRPSALASPAVWRCHLVSVHCRATQSDSDSVWLLLQVHCIISRHYPPA